MNLLKKATLIAEGWSNFLSASEVDDVEAKRRANICAACPKAKKGSLLAMLKDKITKIAGYYCELCGCPLSAKIRTKEKTCDKWM